MHLPEIRKLIAEGKNEGGRRPRPREVPQHPAPPEGVPAVRRPALHVPRPREGDRLPPRARPRRRRRDACATRVDGVTLHARGVRQLPRRRDRRPHHRRQAGQGQLHAEDGQPAQGVTQAKAIGERHASPDRAGAGSRRRRTTSRGHEVRVARAASIADGGKVAATDDGDQGRRTPTPPRCCSSPRRASRTSRTSAATRPSGARRTSRSSAARRSTRCSRRTRRRPPEAVPPRHARPRPNATRRRSCRPTSGSSDRVEGTSKAHRRRATARRRSALAALYFQYGRYLLIARSRPGTQPANLQGVWNELLDPPWESKYTTNINFQMNYWPAELTNLGRVPRAAVRPDRRPARQRRTNVAKKQYGAARLGAAPQHRPSGAAPPRSTTSTACGRPAARGSATTCGSITCSPATRSSSRSARTRR